jgi:hypothetical protein
MITGNALGYDPFSKAEAEIKTAEELNPPP